MKLSKYLLVLPIFLMALTATSASKSVTEISMKPPSGKFLSKLMGMKKQKSKSKGQRKSARLPKMGFLSGNSYHSMMDDQMLSPGPRQDIASLLGVSANHRQEMVGLLSGGSSRLSGMENSPIYYVRLPPTPYMYTPGLGYISQQSSPMSSALRAAESYQGNSVNPFMSLPINFMSNGQPNGAYDFSMPELMSSSYPGKGFLRQEPPIFGRRQFFDDSKFSTLKGRYDFNGRPEGLYVLPDSAYYQSNMFQ